MRGLFALLVIAAIVAATAFLADYPGHVEIVWRDWQINTSVAVLLFAAIVAGFVVWSLLSLLAALVRSPRTVRQWQHNHRRRLGEGAAARGLIAVAAGDAAEARRQTRRAQRFLPNAPLTLLLSAQAAQLNNDNSSAHHLYAAMLDRPELAGVGLRGLLGQAVSAGDHETALRLAARARLAQPKSTWIGDRLLTLETRTGHWQEAAVTLADLVRRGSVPTSTSEHRRGVIQHELSREAEAKGDLRRAVKLAARAQRLAPDLAPLAVHHARLLSALGRQKAANKAIERAWGIAPHPELAQVCSEIHSGETPLTRVRCFEKLAALNPSSPESHVAVAQAALTAQLWGTARRHLTQALADMAPSGPTRHLCLMMARLEESERGAAGNAREWFDRAVTATTDPRYVCGTCGGESSDWHSVCPRCGSFDTLSWQSVTTPAVPRHEATQALLSPAAS